MAIRTLTYRGYEIAVRRAGRWEAHLFRTQRRLPSPQNSFAADEDPYAAVRMAKHMVDALLDPRRKKHASVRLSA